MALDEISTPEQITTIALNAMDFWGLTEQGWTFKLLGKDTENAYARAFYWPRTIVFYRSQVLYLTGEQLENLIKHEIAHALTGPQEVEHGKVWFQKYREVGGDEAAARKRYGKELQRVKPVKKKKVKELST